MGRKTAGQAPGSRDRTMTTPELGDRPERLPPGPARAAGRLKFGGFTLDLQKHTLFRDTGKIHLTPKPLEVLETLVGRAGERVTKEDLLKAVWRDGFVTDDVLVQAVGEIRRALEDDKDNPQFVQTLPREGYRFIAPVESEPAAATTGESPSPPPLDTSPPTTVGAASVRRRWWAGLSLVVIGSILFFYSWLRGRSSGAEWSRPHLVAAIDGSPQSPAFSPDGLRVAYVNAVDGVDQIFVRQLGQGEPRQLTTGDSPAASPSWSPKNDRIVFSRGTPGGGGFGPEHGQESIYSIAPTGGPAVRVIEDGRNPAWSPDASRLVFERGGDLWIAQEDGAGQSRLDGVPRSGHLLANRFPSFSPDGSWIAFFHPETGPQGDFWIIAANGGRLTRLTFDVCRGAKPVWSRDGRSLLVASRRSGVSALWRVPIAGGTPQLVSSATGEDNDPDISRDGRQLVFTNTRNQYALLLLDPATGKTRPLVERRLEIVYPMFDPAGQRISFFMDDREGGGDGVYTVDIAGNNLKCITPNHSERNTFPHWSADGTQLFFYQSAPVSSFRRIAATGGPSSLVIAGWTWEAEYGARVDSGGHRAVYSEERSGLPLRTLIRDLASGQQRAIARALDEPRWSRDDRLILGVDLAAAKPPEGRITTCPADGGACKEIARGYMPVWSARNDKIYFLRTGALRDGAELWITSASGGEERKLAELRPLSPSGNYYDVSPRDEIVFVQFRPGNRELWVATKQ